MNHRISVPIIDNINFIDLQPEDKNPLIQKGTVKVFYIGQNRNGSSIDKETGTKMSKTLRGCPIVGWYKEDKEDFGDHGDQLIINGDGVKFEKLTKPYGFIPLDAKVWFQFFEDQDEWGNIVVREYLMGVLLGYSDEDNYQYFKARCAELASKYELTTEEVEKGYYATCNRFKHIEGIYQNRS